MRRDDVIARLKKVEPTIRAFGVGGLYLFGSVARDEAGKTSDIDLIVEPDDASFYELEHSIGAYDVLAAAFPGIAIGYSTRRGLSRHILPDVDRDAIRVF